MSKITQYVRHLAVVAIATLAAHCAWAATPFAVWEGGFDQASGGFSATANGNEVGNTIKITQNKGVVIGESGGKLNNATYIIHSTGLNLSSESNQYLLTQHQNMLGGGNGDASYNKVGVALGPNGLCAGIWENGYYGNENYQVQKALTDGKILVINIQVNNGVFVYEITEDEQGARTLTKVYGNVNLKTSNTNYKGFTLGGIYEKASSTLVPATGWTITKLAVFNSTLSEADMLGYAFPSEQKNYVFEGETPAWTPSAPKNVKSGDTITINAAGATLDCDAPCTITVAAGASLTTSGDITIGNSQTVISGTLNVNGGTLTLTTKANGGLVDGSIVNIASSATLKSNTGDMPPYSGSPTITVNVRGTLDFAATRWTMQTNTKIVAYKGASIVGDGDQWGAMDPNGKTDTVLEVSNADGEGTVTCSASIRARSAAKVDVAEGMILDYTAAIKNGSSQNNTITKTGLGTMKLSGNSATTGGLTVSAGKMIVSNATVAGGILVAEGAEAELVNTAEAALTVPTIKDGTVGSVTLVSGAFDYGAQRKAIVLGETATIKVTTTTQEAAAGTLTIPGAKEGKVSVFDANGNELSVASVSEDGVITLNTNKPITADCDLSDKLAAGTLIVQGPTEGDPITVNINCPMPNTSLTVIGQVNFNFVEGSEASAGTITLESGAVVTISGTINNAITVQSGAKLVTSGAVTVAESVVIQTPGQKNSIVEIGADSTLTLTANNQIGTNVKVNVYGTLDIGATTLAYNNNPDQCEYNFYAGSVMTGTGAFKMTGGYTAEYYVRANESAANQFVTISVPRARDVYDCAINVNVDNGVGLKWLSSAPNNHQADITIKGSDVRGLEIQNATNVKFGNYDRGLRGAVVIGEGAKLTLSARSDIVSYNYDPKATFDIHGTLELNKRQTIFAANTIKMYDGAKIVGTGEVHSQILKAMDVCDNISIQVSGTVTIDAPLCSRDNGEKITFAKMDGAESASVIMKQTITGPGGLAINGAILTLPTDATKQVSSGAVAKIDGAVAIEGIESTTTYYPSANAAVAASSAEHPAIAITDFTNSTDGLVHADQVLVIPTGITVTATHDMIWWSENGKVIVEGTLNANCNTTLTNGSLELHEGAVVGGTGSLKVDSNKTIVVTGDASVAKISILGSKTLTLDITAGKTLTVGNFIHTGSNKVVVPTGTLVVTANDAAAGIVYEIAADAALTHDLTALGQLIKVKAAEGATIAITSSADPETTELDVSEPVDGVVTYTVVEKQAGPTSWETVTDADVESIVTDLPEGKTVAATALSTWATANEVEFTAGITIPVNALIFNVAPAAAPTAETEAAAADAILADLASKVDISAMAAGTLDADTLALLEKTYPMATIKLVESTKISSDNGKFFQLSIELK